MIAVTHIVEWEASRGLCGKEAWCGNSEWACRINLFGNAASFIDFAIVGDEVEFQIVARLEKQTTANTLLRAIVYVISGEGIVFKAAPVAVIRCDATSQFVFCERTAHEPIDPFLIIVARAETEHGLGLIRRLARRDVQRPYRRIAPIKRALWAAQDFYRLDVAELSERHGAGWLVNAVQEQSDARLNAWIGAS